MYVYLCVCMYTSILMDFLDSRRIAEMNFLQVFLRHTHCVCVYVEAQLPWYMLYYLIDFVFLDFVFFCSLYLSCGNARVSPP